MSKPMGRPPLYATPDALQAAAERYLEEAEQPTIQALSYALGFKSDQQFTMQKYRGESFARVVSVVRFKIDQAKEKRLYEKNNYRPEASILLEAPIIPNMHFV